jgi:hypothetical protein
VDWKLLVDLGRAGLEDYGKIVDAMKVGTVRFVVDRNCWCLLDMVDCGVDRAITSYKAVDIDV